MRLLVSTILVSTLVLASALTAQNCTTIQEGGLLDSIGEPISTGYDEFGYNYQAHMFNGRYCDYDRVIGGSYCDVDLKMKWNDAWLSNTDCDGDERLDRYYGFNSYRGSGAWLTNHQAGSYEVWNEDKGKFEDYHWTYFVKIVAAPENAEALGGIWYDGETGEEIGPVIWGSFAIVQQVENDQGQGIHGVQYISPYSPGFGVYMPDENVTTQDP